MSVGRCTIRKCPTPFDQLGLRSGAAVVWHPVHLFLGHAVAAVLGAVQVQRGLGDVPAPGRGLLGCPFLGAEPAGVELSPVVAQGSLEMRRIADALLDLGQVLGGVVAGGPVGPDPVDEREVVGR